MSAWIVYSKDGLKAKCETRKLTYSGEFMGACSVSVSVSSPSPIEFSIGDFLIYRGERFEINYDPSVIKSSRRYSDGESFQYENIVFNSLSDELTRCDFLDYVSSDNFIHYSSLPTFSFFADSIERLAERIQANLDRVYKGDKKWTVEVHEEYEGKSNVNISVSNMTVWDALALANTQFGATFIIKNRTITIGTAGIPMEKVFSYGKGNGLSKIERNAESSQKIITRLRAYGSTRNMPSGYYHNISGSAVPNNMAIGNLMLPDFPIKTLDPYIESKNIDELGVREGTVFFDGSGDLEEIYPSMEGMTAEDLKDAGVEVQSTGALDVVVSAEHVEDEGKATEGKEIQATFEVTLKDIGFDINDHLSTNAATLSMKDGMCGGREFEIVSCKKEGSNYILTCNRTEDTGLGLSFPYKDYPIRGGDKFVILNIEMPDVYVKAASQRLLSAAEDYLAKNDYVRYSYTPTVDNIFMARQHDEAVSSGLKSIHDTIKEGDLMLFEDEDLGVTGNIIIDTLTIKEDLENSLIPEYEITLKNEKTVGTIEKIQHQIDSIVRNGTGASENGGKLNTEQITAIVKAVGDKTFLRKDKSDRTPHELGVGELEVGNFITGGVAAGGSGARIDNEGRGEMQSLAIREFMEVPELRNNRTDVISGILWNAPAFGLIKSVDTSRHVCTLKLEEGELSGLRVMDICMGIFSNFGEGSETEDGVDDNGFPTMVGFSTSYFTPIEIIKSGKGVCQFRYQLQEGTSVHPCQSMKFAVYGNFVDKSRQASAYSTRTYKRYISGVNTWKIDPDKHIYAQFGLLDGLTIGGMEMKGYGSYQHNCYLSGALIRFTPQQKEELKGESAYSVVLTDYEGIAVLNEDGTLVGGEAQPMNVVTGNNGEIYNVTTDGKNVITDVYRLKTHVQAMRGTTRLHYAFTTEKDGYTITLNPTGCTASVLNGMVAVTSIEDASNASVEIIVTCEGVASFSQTYTITTVADGESVLALTASAQAVTKNSHGHYEPSSVIIRSVKGTKERKMYMQMYGKKSDTEYVKLDMSKYTNPDVKWDVNLMALEGAEYKSVIFRSYKDTLEGKTYESPFDAEVTVNFVNEGSSGAMARNRGQFDSGTQYAYNDEYRDYVWYNDGTSTEVYLRQGKYETTEGCEEGYIKGIPVTNGTYWAKAERSALTAIDTALIDNANIAGFIFHADGTDENGNPLGRLESQNGAIVLDSKNGTAKISGDLYAKTLSISPLNGTTLPRINGRYGMFYMDMFMVANGDGTGMKRYTTSGSDTFVIMTGVEHYDETQTLLIEENEGVLFYSTNVGKDNDSWAVARFAWNLGGTIDVVLSTESKNAIANSTVASKFEELDELVKNKGNVVFTKGTPSDGEWLPNVLYIIE